MAPKRDKANAQEGTTRTSSNTVSTDVVDAAWRSSPPTCTGMTAEAKEHPDPRRPNKAKLSAKQWGYLQASGLTDRGATL